MVISSLCTAFRRIAINRQSNIITRHYSSQLSKKESNVFPSALFLSNTSCTTTNHTKVKFIPRTLNIDFGMPSNNNGIKNIIEIPFKNIPSMEEPFKRRPAQEELPYVDRSFELPTIENIIEKQAVRLIVIRRRKMKKHKRRKLRKRMQFTLAKIRQKRNLLKEKIFQTEQIAKIKEAHMFDPKVYVAEKFALIDKEIPKRVWRGELIPVAMIKEFQAIKDAKKKAKRNRPRLTL